MDRETPLLRQYRAVKAAHPEAILMFRIGDFFEMFEKDAEIAARELELTLTGKAMGKAGRLPLAGVPHHAVETYIARLVKRGYHVAVCDQTEDPAQAKGLVKREVTRLVTPGTYSAEDNRSNNFLAAYVAADPWGIAFCDVLTGELYTAAGRDPAGLAAHLARFRPAELLVPDALEEPARASLTEACAGLFITPLPSWQFSASYAEDLLKAHFKTGTLAPLGLADDAGGVNAEGVAAAVILTYLKETQKTAPAHVTAVRRIAVDDSVVLAPTALLNLEITESPSGDREATLIRLMDEAVTAMGSRLIRRRLQSPRRDAAELTRRLSLVEAFHGDALCRADARTILKRVHDLERLAGRLSLGTISPRELVGLARSLVAVADLRALMTHEILAGLAARLDPLPEVTKRITERLVEEPPLEIGDAPLFRPGVYPQLDEIRAASAASRRWIAELQEKERARTGISSLKVGFNNVFNYYIEVTKANLDKVPADYIRKQTTSNAERYFTEELKKHEDVVMKADDRLREIEQKLFAELRVELLPFLARLQETGAVVAEIDLSAAFAEVAERRRYVRPAILEEKEPVFRVEKGRHPVVEALLAGAESFVPNDMQLGADRRLMILTGPNMAGKSTYIRQAAVIALMAQVGSFVPAERCALTPFDAIFTRIGASDRLARGLSTFMVEMVEAAAILRGATPRSLVILDEIGRGTSTYDGLSIAWALVEALAGRQSLALFATHYHELTVLAESVPGVFNATVAVREWHDRIHFLHEIRAGAADRSYGIQVASLAGVTAPVIARAKEILAALEMGELRSRAREVCASIDEPEQLTFWSVPADPCEAEVLSALREADPDSLSPRQAHELLVRLRAKLEPSR